jgi:hypothetical protein
MIYENEIELLKPLGFVEQDSYWSAARELQHIAKVPAGEAPGKYMWQGGEHWYTFDRTEGVMNDGSVVCLRTGGEIVCDKQWENQIKEAVGDSMDVLVRDA